MLAEMKQKQVDAEKEMWGGKYNRPRVTEDGFKVMGVEFRLWR